MPLSAKSSSPAPRPDQLHLLGCRRARSEELRIGLPRGSACRRAHDHDVAEQIGTAESSVDRRGAAGRQAGNRAILRTVDARKVFSIVGIRSPMKVLRKGLQRCRARRCRRPPRRRPVRRAAAAAGRDVAGRLMPGDMPDGPSPRLPPPRATRHHDDHRPRLLLGDQVVHDDVRAARHATSPDRGRRRRAAGRARDSACSCAV